MGGQKLKTLPQNSIPHIKHVLSQQTHPPTCQQTTSMGVAEQLEFQNWVTNLPFFNRERESERERERESFI
jgi:hypothetical protein